MTARQRIRPGADDSSDSSDSDSQGKGPRPAKPYERSPFRGISTLDILRVLGGIVVLNCALSWLVTGESVSWGYRPWFTKAGMVKAWWRGPLLLTDAELLAYDGTDPEKPIYVAVDGDIFDVTEGRRFYGPGGSYHFFAGRDAARAWVTGCFDTDLTPDLRGVEEIYVPVDPEVPAEQEQQDLHSGPAEEEVDGELRRKGGRSGSPKAGAKDELKKRSEREYRDARKKVRATLEGWKSTFRGESGKNYFWVGKVKREKGWLEKLPRRELCEAAKKQRPKRRRDDK